MSSPTDIANRALAEIGTRSSISSFTENSTEAYNASIFYDPLRRNLLRAVHWGCAREQLTLSQLGQSVDGTGIFPFLYKYAYPSEALALRYLLPTPPDGLSNSVPMVPQRGCRFIIAVERVSGVRRKVIISNVYQAIGIFTADLTETNLFDPLLEEALACALASKLVIPLSGNIQMKGAFIQQAQAALLQAQAADGNEAVPTTDHVPDWIRARGYPCDISFPFGDAWGQWFSTPVPMTWGD